MKGKIRQLLRAIGFLAVRFCEDRPRLNWLAMRIWVTFLAESLPPPEPRETLKKMD